MPDYTSENTLRVAKRFQNAKRAYLLVNPLQAKHIPVSPSKALAMMNALGSLLARRWPETRLVIGFAETATAIGAAVAAALSPDCIYLPTTREAFPKGQRWVEFREEHSHAVEQKLCGDGLPARLEGTDTVILVDDEISTGNTLINMVEALRQAYPLFREKRIVAASILNRVPPENEARMARAGIESACLVKLPREDYTARVVPLSVREAEGVEPAALSLCRETLPCAPLRDPRLGLPIGAYRESCAAAAEAFLPRALRQISPGSRVTVLGTEECMYPALLLGKRLEEAGQDYRVRCHATTRSPIGVCGEPGYPIFSGRKLPSFYDENRATYLYDMESCDALVVVSDTPEEGTKALGALAAAFPLAAGGRGFYLQGGQHDCDL